MTSMSDLHAELMAGGQLLLDDGQDNATIEKYAFSNIYHWVIETLIANPDTYGNRDPQATVSVDTDWVTRQAKAVTRQITGERNVSSSADLRRSKLGTDHTPES